MLPQQPVALAGECSFTDFSPVTENELRSIVMKSPTKGCSLDPIPTRMVKQVMTSFIPLMTALINSSLASGDIPDSMKVARVSPLLKKPSMDSEDLKSYRPVSNLSFLSKLLERVVAKKLQSYIWTCMDYMIRHNQRTGPDIAQNQHSLRYKMTCSVPSTSMVFLFW